MFSYNQTITNGDLNNVAIDLGSATFNNFSNGVEYAVNSLNGITEDLVTKGILFTLNRFMPSLSGSTLSIGTGVAVFSDGAKIRMTDSASITLASTSTTQYCFLRKNSLTDIELCVEPSLPASLTNIVKICTISGGEVVDTREYSLANTLKANPRIVTLSGSTWASERKTCTINTNISSFCTIYFTLRKSNSANLIPFFVNLGSNSSKSITITSGGVNYQCTVQRQGTNAVITTDFGFNEIDNINVIGGYSE